MFVIVLFGSKIKVFFFFFLVGVERRRIYDIVNVLESVGVRNLWFFFGLFMVFLFWVFMNFVYLDKDLSFDLF